MIPIRLLLGACVVLLVGGSSSGQVPRPFQPGDLLVGEANLTGIGYIGSLQWFPSSGGAPVTIEPYIFDGAFAAGFDAQNRLLVGRLGSIDMRDASGNFLSAFGPAFSGLEISSLTFDRAGNVYVGLAFGSNRIVKLTNTGAVIRTFDLPLAPAAYLENSDLAADQCTLFYVEAGSRVKRYDLCADAALPDFVTTQSAATDVRILPNGAVLIATTSGGFLYSASGQLLRAYVLPAPLSWQTLAVMPGAGSFWAGTTGGLFHVDLATGVIIADPIATLQQARSVAIYGEPRAALAAPGPADVPVMSGPMVIALTVFLGGVAVLRLRLG